MRDHRAEMGDGYPSDSAERPGTRAVHGGPRRPRRGSRLLRAWTTERQHRVLPRRSSSLRKARTVQNPCSYRSSDPSCHRQSSMCWQPLRCIVVLEPQLDSRRPSNRHLLLWNSCQKRHRKKFPATTALTDGSLPSPPLPLHWRSTRDPSHFPALPGPLMQLRADTRGTKALD